MKKKFCNFLGNGLYISNRSYDLQISPCCFYKNPVVLKNFSKSINNLDTHINSLLDKSSKMNFSHSACARCIQQEQSNIPSYRQSSFVHKSSNENHIVALTIDIDRKCNLACASCSEHDSSLWFKEKQKFSIPMDSSIYDMHKNNTDEFLQKTIDDICKLDLSKLEWIKFGGGEPLLSNTHFYFLQKLHNQIDTTNLTLNYTSNYSIVPSQKVFDMWNNFKTVELSGSIDGVEDQFYFLRWPLRFEKLKVNLKLLQQNSPNNVQFKVEHTLNPLNIFYYDELQKFLFENFRTNKNGHPTSLNVHPCWGTIGLSHVHKDVILLTKQKLGASHKVIKLAEQSYKGTKLNTTYLDKLDEMRGTNWRAVFPDVEKYYD